MAIVKFYNGVWISACWMRVDEQTGHPSQITSMAVSFISESFSQKRDVSAKHEYFSRHPSSALLNTIYQVGLMLILME